MGLFDKFKKKENNCFENAYVGNPHFYKQDDDHLFGAFVLTEGTLTSLPKNPKSLYKVNNTEEIDDWKLMLVSTTIDEVLDDLDYFLALSKLKKHVVDENDDYLLIKGLSLKELKEILE